VAFTYTHLGAQLAACAIRSAAITAQIQLALAVAQQLHHALRVCTAAPAKGGACGRSASVEAGVVEAAIGVGDARRGPRRQLRAKSAASPLWRDEAAAGAVRTPAASIETARPRRIRRWPAGCGWAVSSPGLARNGTAWQPVAALAQSFAQPLQSCADSKV